MKTKEKRPRILPIYTSTADYRIKLKKKELGIVIGSWEDRWQSIINEVKLLN
jgi:hypothetical protein